MDDFRPVAGAIGPAGGNRRSRDPGDLPPGFQPLRLLLQPTGSSVELNHPDLVIGRHSEADVRLPLPDVSRRHCRFYFHEGAWHVRDLKSLNGTFVNDQQVEESLICHGDTVRLGGFTFLAELVAIEKTAAKNVILSISRSLPPTISPDELPPSRKAS